MTAPNLPVAAKRYTVIASHPTACICSGTRAMNVLVLGRETWRRMPCPHCTNAGPLLRWITKGTR